MSDPPSPPPDRFRRVWRTLVAAVGAVWVVLFVVYLLHVDFPVWHFADAHSLRVMARTMLLLLPIFAVNLYLSYRWSGLSFPAFFRRRWLDFLMLIPVFRILRVFRLFRVGRYALMLRHAARGRKVFSLGRKGKRYGTKAAKGLRARQAATAGDQD